MTAYPPAVNRLAPKRMLAECLIAFACGSALLVLPVALDPATAAHPGQSKVLPMVASAAEGGVKLYSLGLLVGLGVCLGFLARSPALLLSLCAVLVFPIWSIADLASGRGHRWLVLEWLIYGLYLVLPLIGIASARAARKYLTSETEPGP